jgi:hypothetical protein
MESPGTSRTCVKRGLAGLGNHNHGAPRSDKNQLRNYICPDPVWHAEKHAKPRHHFSFFEKGLGHKTLASLTVGTITKFRDDQKATGLSVPTTRKILATLQVMLDYAISIDLMAINVAKDVEVIGRRDETIQRIEPPNKEVMRQLSYWIAMSKPTLTASDFSLPLVTE